MGKKVFSFYVNYINGLFIIIICFTCLNLIYRIYYTKRIFTAKRDFTARVNLSNEAIIYFPYI